MLKFLKVVGLAALITTHTASANVMLGAYLPGDGFTRSEIADYNAAMPKPLAFVNLFTSFSHDWDSLYWQTTNIVDEGAMPLVSWMPVDLSRPDANILSEIALGLHDDYIDEWAQRLKDWVAQYPIEEQPTILLRFGHEFNGNWYSYGNSPFFYKSAWQYIHDKFETTGANQYIEWVWSANNVNVDDYDDVTHYYPGSEYVDWTSIDGYNFGSNYTWTSWEAFSDVYSDSYLTLVNYYPEKPILIAEIGTAEAADFPNPQWGQFGDDSDAYESKTEWISDLLIQLETNYPAVRAVSWFNINKELCWSLTHSVNTGVTSWVEGVQSDYFTSDFLSSPGSETTNTERLMLERLLAEAQETQTSAQKNFDYVQAQLVQAEQDINVAEANNKTLSLQRSTAKTAKRNALNEYVNARETYLTEHQKVLSSRAEFVENSTTRAENRSQYLDQVELYKSAYAKRQNADQAYKVARQLVLDDRQNFLDSRNAYREANKLWQERDLSGDVDALEVDLNTARDAFLEKRDATLVLRNEYLDKLAQLRTANTDLASTTESKKSRLELFRQSIEALKESRDLYNAAVASRNAKLDNFRSHRDIYLERKGAFSAIDQSYKVNLLTIESATQEFVRVQALHQKSNTARAEAYAAVSDARQHLSLEAEHRDGIMLSDSSNKNKEKDKLDKEQKKLAKKVKIDKNAQKALAESNKPDPTDPEKIKTRKEKYKNISEDEMKTLKLQKLTVLSY